MMIYPDDPPIPTEQLNHTVEDKLRAMVAAGLAAWSGEPLGEPKARASVKPGHSVAQIVVEDRI